jgi:predicted ATP-grasp superfamily ATP-dependent carboligase
VVDLPDPGPLRDPVVVAAFEGWNDAGDAATGAIEHLEIQWRAERLGALDPEDYYDFQVNRPTVSLVDGVTRRISWPTTRFSLARTEGRDVVLVRGIEPNMRWRGFCAEILDAVVALKAELVVTFGALLADSPHTRPVPVTGSATDPEIAARVRVEKSRYEGPTGIVGVLHDTCGVRSLPSVSFWAAVPHYVAQPPSPKATIALLRRLEGAIEVPVPLGSLPEQAAAWQQQVDELAAEDSDVAEYVRTLEARETEPELTEASGEDLAKAFEDYLRDRGEGKS